MLPNSPQKAFVDRLKKVSRAAKADESLRWNQLDVINTAAKFLEAKEGTSFSKFGKDVPDSEKDKKKNKNNMAMIESSPGSGKTRIMGTLAKVAANLNGYKGNGADAVKVLLLTPRLGLNQQTLKELDEELGIKDADVGVFDGNQNIGEKKRAKNVPVLIGTYQSIPKMLQEGIISFDPASPQYRGLVMMDEAHELYDFSYKPNAVSEPLNITSFMNDNQMTFLFTGTDDGVSARHFGGAVPTIYSKRLVKAHNEGLTCEHIYPGLVDIGVKTSDWEDHIHATSGNMAEQNQEFLEYFSGHPKVIEAAVDSQLTAKEPNMGYLNRYKSLFFVDGVKAGEKGAEYYNKRAQELGLKNLKAAHIGKGERKKRRELSDDLEVNVHFDFGEQMAIAEVMRAAHEAALREAEAAKEIPKTSDGREYISIPDEQNERVKNRFFKKNLDAAEEAGMYRLMDKLDIPVDKISSKRGQGIKIYIHPDVYLDLNQKFASEKHTEVPRTEDGRDYLPAPIGRFEGQLKYRFFRDAIRVAEENGSYPIKDKPDILSCKIQAKYGHGGKIYIHPDVFLDLTQKFESEKHTKIPKIKDGREYVILPHQEIELVKRKFFNVRIAAAQKAGAYIIEKKQAIPANKIKISYDRKMYLHPDVYVDLSQKFASERHVEVPKTEDGREYLPAPHTVEQQQKSRFFIAKILDAGTEGDYSIENKPRSCGHSFEP